ncbi:MAG: HAD family hydrolase [Candidatus Melainabacteria bacterium]|nr:HAD family hydrolase [Candidatus Melainabacteria bacterium]
MSDLSRNKPLLILDLDETLIRGTTLQLPQEHFVVLHPYFVYKRPHVSDFLASVSEHFSLAIWSSANMPYIAAIARPLWQGLPEPLFVWDRGYCMHRYNPYTNEIVYIKDLRKVASRGRELNRTLIVDDDLGKVTLHYGNAVLVKPFCGEPDDAELPLLADYLRALAQNHEDLQRVDKAGWRNAGGQIAKMQVEI